MSSSWLQLRGDMEHLWSAKITPKWVVKFSWSHDHIWIIQIQTSGVVDLGQLEMQGMMDALWKKKKLDQEKIVIFDIWE